MIPAVDNPIFNLRLREPKLYWLYDTAGMPRVENKRRPAVIRVFDYRAGAGSVKTVLARDAS